MRRPPAWSLLMLLAACDARISAGANDLAGGDDAGGSAGSDAGGTGDAPAGDAGLGKFSAPKAIPQASSTTKDEDDATLTSDGLEMVFAIVVDAAKGKDLYYTSRPTTSDAWATAVPVPFNDNLLSDETPRFSADDKTLYFASARAPTKGGLDVFSIKRDNTGSNVWRNLAPVAGINTTLTDKWYMPCGTQYLMVQDNGAMGTRFVGGALGTTGTPVDELNAAAPSSETGTFFTKDCLTLYFASTRVTPTRIFMSHRDSVTAKWATPTVVTDFPIGAGTDKQEDPWMSPDGKIFVLVSDAAGTKDVYISTR